MKSIRDALLDLIAVFGVVGVCRREVAGLNERAISR
jgi:hypothetical protein